MAAGKTQFQRKRMWINPRMQRGMIIRVFLTVLIFTTLLSGATYFAVYTRLTESINEGKESLSRVLSPDDEGTESTGSALRNIQRTARETQATSTARRRIFFDMLIIFGANIVFSLLIIYIIFVPLSHRIAGPVYRFEQVLAALREGDLTQQANLRKGDEMQELAEAFNLMAKSMNSRMAELSTLTQTLKDQVANNDPAAKETAAALEEKIRAFKVSYN